MSKVGVLTHESVHKGAHLFTIVSQLLLQSDWACDRPVSGEPAKQPQ